MRDNFNVHEWRIDQIRQENTLKQSEDKATKRVNIVTDHILDSFPELDRGQLRMVVAGAFTELAIQRLLEEPSIEGLNEGWNDNIDKIDLMYTNYGTLYKVKVDGKTVNTKDVEDLIGMEIPIKGYYHSDDVIAVVDALKRKGIQADSFEMDVD